MENEELLALTSRNLIHVMKSGGLFGGTRIKSHSRALSTQFITEICSAFICHITKKPTFCCCCYLIGYICDLVKTSNLNDKDIKDEVLNNKEIFK